MGFLLPLNQCSYIRAIKNTDIPLHADTQHRAVLRQYIQGDGGKFLGNFKRHFVPQISSESLKQGKKTNICNQGDFDSGCKRANFCRRQISGSAHGYSETRSRSNVRKKHTYTKGHKYNTFFPFFFLFFFSFFFLVPPPPPPPPPIPASYDHFG